VVQLLPATQEKLIAYEIGAKTGLLDETLQLNAAVFYYDYTDKQVLGAIPDPFFGSLPAMVNVPESHVIGGEISVEWYPLEGLRIAPAYSYAKSEVDGEFLSFDPFFIGGFNADLKDFTGQEFPNAPTGTANLDLQYEWALGNGWIAFVGANANWQDDTKAFFYDTCPDPTATCTQDIPTLVGDWTLEINDRTLLDLRAGVEADGWRVWAWGRNVTDEHYWNQMQHVNDVLLRFAGMPPTYGVSVSMDFGG
jgi:outer membrane receptor protein involved in Fe transport